jgi:hypothetical protein
MLAQVQYQPTSIGFPTQKQGRGVVMLGRDQIIFLSLAFFSESSLCKSNLEGRHVT